MEGPTSPVVNNPIALNSQPSIDHTPAFPSPLNPDPSRRPSATPAQRQQREKKDSLKKRESAIGTTKASTPESKVKAQNLKSRKTDSSSTQFPLRYGINTPDPAGFTAPAPHSWASHEPTPFLTPDGRTELKRPVDCAQNTKQLRCKLAVADPLFKHKEWYRNSEAAPYGACLSITDSDKWIHFNEQKTMLTNERGWRMARANVLAREGSFYYEVKIVRGVLSQGPPVTPGSETIPQPHIRMGWSRREAPLDAPVGFDGYSYGITDIRFQTIHKSRPGKIMAPKTGKPAKSKSKSKAALTAAASANARSPKIEDDTGSEDHIREGDVVGLLITLPSLSLQRKVVDGIYNPAVDVGDGFDAEDAQSLPNDIIRDRAPVIIHKKTYFEHYEYQPTKGMESYGDRGPNNHVAPNPNHEDASLRSLPHSSIKVYKNGEMVGTAFENLMSFLPPASASATAGRQHLDDGYLGYFPAVASFAGGIAELNFGPDFWHPPVDLNMQQRQNNGVHQDTVMQDVGNESIANSEPLHQIVEAATPVKEDFAASRRRLRPMGERFQEQVAEDIVWDIVDEASFFALDGGYVADPNAKKTAADAGISINDGLS